VEIKEDSLQAAYKVRARLIHRGSLSDLYERGRMYKSEREERVQGRPTSRRLQARLAARLLTTRRLSQDRHVSG
jgi:hypothetical protein